MGLIGRIWRGEEGLARTFWVYGFAANVVLRGISLLLTAVAGKVPAVAVALLVWAFMVLAYQIFAWVAIWRSANRYEGYPGWAYLAKSMVVLGVVLTLFSFFRPV